jgi:uncharacterized protein (TIGR01777 family)
VKIAISGASGFVGDALIAFFAERGDTVTRIVRSYGGVPHGEATVVWHPQQGVIERAGLEGHDVVIHLAGESIAGVWTGVKKRKIRESREQGTSLLARTLAALESPPKLFASASAMGFYGDRREVVDESSAPGTGFLAEVAQLWEAATQPAEQAGIRTVHMRFGNILHPGGGMLAVLVPLYRLGLGAPFGEGGQAWPWIARDDVVSGIAHLIDHAELHGPVNFVAPETVTNEEFTNALAAAVGRPSFLRVPAFAAKLAPGGMSEEMLLGGAPIVPRKLLESGYPFRWPKLREALKAMLQD